jgi:hypothetical protein
VLPHSVLEALAALSRAPKAGLLDASVEVALVVVHELLEAEVSAVVGPKGRRAPGRAVVRHGHEARFVTLGGRRVPVRRPRVRTVDRQHEVRLRTYAHFGAREQLTVGMLDRLLARIAMRRYVRTGQSADSEPDAIREPAAGPAAVGEFLPRTRRKLTAVMSRSLDDPGLAAVMLAGIELEGRRGVVALGIDAGGATQPVGVWDGSAENATVARAVVAELRERRLDVEQVVPVVVGEAKALREALHVAFGTDVPVRDRSAHDARGSAQRLRATWPLDGRGRARPLQIAFLAVGASAAVGAMSTEPRAILAALAALGLVLGAFLAFRGSQAEDAKDARPSSWAHGATAGAFGAGASYAMQPRRPTSVRFGPPTVAGSAKPMTPPLVLIGVLLSAIAGLAVNHITGRLAVAAAFAAVATWAVAQRWGAVVAVTPVLLLPGLPAQGLSPILTMAILTLALASGHWLTGAGRPKLSRWGLAAAITFGGASVLSTFGNGGNTTPAWALLLFLVAGVVLGTCVIARPEGLLAIGFLGVFMGGLAILEALGLHNYWLDAVHGNTFARIADYEGAKRARSTLGHPLIAGAVIGAIGVLMISHPSRWKRLIVPVALGGCLATVSRSSILALLAAGLVILIQNRDSVPRFALNTAVIAAVLYALVSQVPALRDSFETRVLHPHERQTVRQYSVTDLRTSWARRPGDLLLGGGVGASTDRLEAVGGVNGFFIFDNQYVTAIYDDGLLVLLATFALIGLGLASAGRTARRVGLPALVLIAVVGAFVDGIYWGPYTVLLGLAIGVATAPSSRVTASPRRMAATRVIRPGRGGGNSLAADPAR